MGSSHTIVGHLLLLLLYLNVSWRRQFWGEAGVSISVGEINADDVADLRS
jgi:hypothetical protein